MQISVVGGKRVARVTKTSNISSGGVCFPSAKEVGIGGKIEFSITLADGAAPVQIRCFGKVLRIESLPNCDPVTPFQVTATIERYKFVRD
ncbi:MAG: hypothetical protein M3Z09_08600 [Acidobacteriota bacterium]|nr:hypothetical protein [Acidobacteriota bacterium]